MENAIIERFKNQMRNLKVLSEELQVQMALGKAEARDLIEKEKKNFSQYLQSQRTQMEDFDSSSSEKRRTFLTAVENLESALYDKIPEESLAYDNYKNSLLASIYRVEEVVKENYPNLSSEMKNTLDGFKAKMDAFRVNLALHDKDNPELVAKIRGEFTEKLKDVRGLLAKNETEQTKLDHFVEDISESFEYFKKAISDLSN